MWPQHTWTHTQHTHTPFSVYEPLSGPLLLGLTHLYEIKALSIPGCGTLASNGTELVILHVSSLALPWGLVEDPPIWQNLPERLETRSLTS